KKSTTAMQAGISRAKEAMVEMGSKAKELVGKVVALGSAFSAAAAAHKALETQSALTNLAFRIETATKQATSWRDVQRQLEPMALRVGKTTGEMAEAFNEVFTSSKNLAYTQDAIEAV